MNDNISFLIIIFALSFCLFLILRFILRAFFNKEWRNDAQEKIDAVKKERVFWSLVRGQDGLNLGVDAIFTICISPAAYITYAISVSGFGTRTEDDERTINLIKRYNIFESQKILNIALEKTSDEISSVLSESVKEYTNAKIKSVFDKYEKDYSSVSPKDYNIFVSSFLSKLPEKEYVTGNEIWDARKKIKEDAYEYELKAERQINLKMIDTSIGKAVCELLYTDSNNVALKKALLDWENIQGLRWCINDLIFPWIGTNIVERFWYRVIANFVE